MDEKLKQRLTGTVVITLLLAFFLPMLIDDTTDQQKRSLSEMKIPQLPEEIFVEELQPMPLNSPERVELSTNRHQSEYSILINNNRSEANPKKPVAPKAVLVRWVIQVGSFASKEHALKLRDDLRAKKFTVYTAYFKGMHRVRIGPELDKRRAEKTLQMLAKKTQIKGLLMAE
jgi:DedD protein